jgi:putative heme-binding domain-containing protein
VALAFRGDGELFCSDQEGATWLANGNPFDELLHIERGRHYGFPPRHPKRLPGVIDEPSVFDYVPQHQSTCGLVFNEPVVSDGPIIGPPSWRGDAIIAGYSRGKLYRTALVRTEAGYVARNSLIACLNQLTVEGALTRDGDLIVSTHSGGPDWGTGPSGKGRLYKIRYQRPDVAQPVAVWAASPGEVRVAFDRPLDPERLRGITSQVSLQRGAFVRAGDRFESLRPGYAVVGAQLASPRFEQAVRSVQLSSDQRTLLLFADPAATADLRALTLPASIVGEQPAAADAVKQHPQIDLDYDLTGVEARWQNAAGETKWSGWLPHVDLDVCRAFTMGSAEHDALWPLLSSPGKLTITAQLNLVDMLRPAVQPGSTIDYEWPNETVTISARASGTISLRSPGIAIPGSEFSSAPQRGKLVPIELTLVTSNRPAQLTLHWTTSEDDRPRELPLRRLLVPWADAKPRSGTELALTRPKELDGGSWARGRKVFFDEKLGCAKCHSVHGRGAIAAPDLSNLLHRDYASVLRDVAEPSYAINPDFVTYTVAETSGRSLSGTVRTEGDKLLLTDQTGKLHTIERKNVDEIAPSRISTMPNDVPKLLGPERLKDVLTFLLTPAPQMPRDALLPAPPPRSRAEVRAVLDGAPVADAPGSPNVGAPKELRITLVAGPKDHGPGEHDYPAWQKAWAELLGALDHTAVNTAWEWPAAEHLAKSDVLVFYQHGSWSAEKARDIDVFLARGGGLVYLHFAVDGGPQPVEFAQRIGLAWRGGQSKFRHGPLELAFGSSHPIARNFDRVQLVDESYWRLTGRVTAGNVLATAIEDGEPQPLFWAIESGGGRVFVSIPGHYSWTFDDPLFRILILRGIAWTARAPVDRLNDAVWPGARVGD